MGKLINRARMTVASAPGTGVITLGSAVAGNQSFASAGLADGDVVSYVAESGYSNGVPSVWEYGQGTYAASGTTLTRTTVQGGTSGTSPVNLTADAQVFVTPLAGDLGIQRAAAVASTAGVAIDFTGIPSGTKRVTLLFAGVSHAGGTPVLVQIGTASGIEATGYASGATSGATGVSSTMSTAGIPLAFDTNGNLFSGSLTFFSIGGNTWVASGAFCDESGAFGVSGGRKTLANTLSRVRITTVAGNVAFDSGSISLMWE